MSNNRSITADDIKIAANLKRLFLAEKRASKITYEEAAHKLGWAGAAAINNYVNAKAALGLEAGLKFAALLNVEPSAINPAWAEHDSSEVDHLSPLQRSCYEDIKLLDEDQLQALSQLLKQMKKV